MMWLEVIGLSLKSDTSDIGVRRVNPYLFQGIELLQKMLTIGEKHVAQDSMNKTKLQVVH
jgi:hypothetical protein